MKKSHSEKKPLKIGLISLGCAKNLVDAEIMLGALMQSGMEITNDAASADAVIVNTCSFIDAAQEESVDAILESDQVRQANHRGQALIVSGCLPQRFRQELPALLPEVDAFVGIDQVAEIAGIVRQAIQLRAAGTDQPHQRPARKKERRVPDVQKPPQNGAKPSAALDASAVVERTGATEPVVQVHSRPTYIPDYATPRFRLTPAHFAYLKIAEGCNHPCSFCTIPRMRGAHRSRSEADVVMEARRLIAEGVKELNLISQDSTYYGLDLRPNRNGSIASPQRFQAAAHALPAAASTLCTLLRALNALEGDFWIRLLYTHPAHWTDELIETIAACPKVARYVDMPLQHIHDVMLERMRRETRREHIVQLIGKIRRGIPGIALRTTFIVGFPGETEVYFEELLAFIRETRFERLGVFTYSKEEGTRAGAMAQQIPAATKNARRNRAMVEQLKISRQIAAAAVGQRLCVLVEKDATREELAKAQIRSWEHGLIRKGHSSENLPRRFMVARSQADAPDIDGRVYLSGHLPAGQFATVQIVGHTDYDLLAVPHRWNVPE